MASIFKRGKVWWIDFINPAGDRIRRSTGTQDKKEAQEYCDRVKSDSWRVAKLSERPRRTWDEAAVKWLDETQHKATHEGDKSKLFWLQQFLRLRYLDEITRDYVAQIGRVKAGESSPATANRYLALIRTILRKACHEWEWTDRAVKISLYREAKRRVRWITPDQAKILLAELNTHQREVVLFALATGLRQSNVALLEWSQIDLARRTAWVFSDQAKGNEDIHVSLNDIAMEVLQRQIGKHAERVFTYLGKPIKCLNTKAWRNALKRAGISNFRWHDLRHTWASWLVQNGTSLYDLQEMGAWKSGVMVKRYAHLAPANLANRAAIITELLNDTNMAQSGKKEGLTLL